MESSSTPKPSISRIAGRTRELVLKAIKSMQDKSWHIYKSRMMRKWIHRAVFIHEIWIFLNFLIGLFFALIEIGHWLFIHSLLK